jgi:translation initiation factor IF-3
MRKSYKFKRKEKIEKNYSFNYQIRSPQVEVIDETGTSIGVMDTRAAIAAAQERGLDLVEVAPNAKPPVAKILDYGSFQYQKEKQLKKQKKLNKTLDVKSIRLSIKISDHDLETRIKQAEKFLVKGHKLKVEIILRGREMAHTDLAREMLKTFRTKLTTPTEVDQDMTKQGNKVFTILMTVK